MSPLGQIRKKLRPIRSGARTIIEVVKCAWRGQANIGYCPICQGPTVFYERSNWLRDDYLCARCGSIPRFRALVHVLNQEYPNWRGLRIFESSPEGPSSKMVARECKRYTSTQFFPDVPVGKTRDGVRCENLEALTYPDASFDLVITQDVMEHVFHPEDAFREIARVIAPGGAHVFTVPVLMEAETVVRSVQTGDGVTHLKPPEYHGNPISEEGSLVVRDWGGDILQCIKSNTGLHTDVIDLRDRRRGLIAEYLQVFVTRKPKG